MMGGRINQKNAIAQTNDTSHKSHIPQPAP